MKKIKKQNTDDIIFSKNGILIDGDITLSCDKEPNKISFKAVKFLIALCTVICTIFMTVSFMDIDIIYPSVLLLLTMLTFAFSALDSSSKILKAIGLGYIAIQTAAFIPMASSIQNGFFIVINIYLKKANQPNSAFGAYLNEIRPYDYEYYATCFFVFIGSIIVLFLALSCIFRIDFPLMFFITFPFFELGMYWGWKPKTWTAIGLIICWITVLALQIINHSTNKAGRKNTFAVHKRKKAFYFTSPKIKQHFFAIYARGIVLLCAGIFLSSIIFSTISGFVRPESFTQMRRDISNAVDNFSFTSMKNMFEDYDGGLDLFGVKTVGGTNGGILGQADSISFNGSTALKVGMSKPDYPLYLRGYVAGEYDENSWKNVEVAEDDEIVQLFDDYDLNIQDFNYYMNDVNNQLAIMNGFDTIGTNQTIDVTVVGASKKFVYAPYMTDYSSDTNSGDDKMVCTPESYVNLRKKKYSLRFADMSSLGGNWNDIIGSLINGFSDDTNLNAEYRSFVNENYTDVYESKILDNVYNEITEQYMYGEEVMSAGADITYITDAISAYFSDNYKYTLSPGTTPKDEDFIDYFLKEQREGYCSYYASAGVMLMRKFGYPARYVEGYVVLPSQFTSDESDASAVVTDKSAHAWCEIYIDNIGWLPCEFTPGYDNDNPNLTEKEKNPSATTTMTTTTTSSHSKTNTATSKTSTSSVSKTTTSEKAVTTKKSVSEENSSDAFENSTSEGSAENHKSERIAIIVVYVLGAVIVISAIIIRRKLNLVALRKKINAACNSDAIKNIYIYYLKYLSLLAVGTDKNITDMQAVSEILEQCANRGIYGIDSDFTRLSELAVEAHMSGSEMTDAEAEFARKTLDKLSKQIVSEKLSLLGRISAKWIYNLY